MTAGGAAERRSGGAGAGQCPGAAISVLGGAEFRFEEERFEIESILREDFSGQRGAAATPADPLDPPLNYGQARNEKQKVGVVNLDRRKKRISLVNQTVEAEVIQNTKKKISSIKRGREQIKQDSVNDKLSRTPPRTIWVSGRTRSATSKTNHPSTGVVNDTENGKSSSNIKEANRWKKQSTRKSDVSSATSVLKTAGNKQSLNDGEMEDQPKKKKKKNVIRIDPHDASNKRLDDGEVSISERTKETNKCVEREAEMSKNAQFRSIQPSPSILSFVEDNLLGRRREIELKRAGYNIELSAPLDNIPLSTSTERERIEESIFRNKLEFFAAAKVSSSFPDPDLPEIAFAGRSNVGKSSLLNALTRQWGVARTSDKPGLTQTINFFKLGSKMCLVDLPGYGFAYAKEEVKDAWEELVKEYVSTRVGLKRVCLLIDTKWGMKPRDHELISLMERSQTKYQVVLTKTDVVFPIDVARRAMQIEEALKENKSIVQPVMMVSSKSGAGIRSLRTVLSKISRFAKL